jgi:hypothetical protein
VPQETIEQLHARLAGQVGHERAMTLIRIAQEEMNLAVRIHPQNPGGRAHLEEALRAVEEAYGYFGPKDAMRGPVAVLYGVVLALKNAIGGGSEADRERAIELIEDSFTFPNVPPLQVATGRLMLGQLLVERAARPMQSPDAMLRAMTGGLPAVSTADLDRAADCFREVIKVSSNADMTSTATTMLSVTELFRDLLGGVGPRAGGLDLGRMASAVSALQGMQSKGFGMNLSGSGLTPGMNLLDLAKGLADMDPLDRPVPLVHGPEPEEDVVASPRPTLTVDVEVLRRDLAELLSVSRDDVCTKVISVLRSADPAPWTDDLVALATRVVHAADPALGTDHLVLSAALLLRSRRDGDDGWGETDGAPDSDLEAAVDELAAAARDVPREHADAVPLLLLLAALLPAGTLDRLTEPFAETSGAVRALSAGALIIAHPPGLPWLDAQTGRLMAADAACHAQSIVVLGDGADDLKGDKAVSWLASVAQLLELSRRAARPITEEVVFVTNPRGDRETTTVDALLLRRSFYPRSRGLGRLVENADGEATPDQVRAAASGASLLHLACGLTAGGALELAESGELDVSEIEARGGLVILPPGAFLPAADALLAAGFTGVVGWRQAVPEQTASLMLYLLHAELAETGRSPAAAVREVRRWARRPDTSVLPRLLARYADSPELMREEDWSALVYRGR